IMIDAQRQQQQQQQPQQQQKDEELKKQQQNEQQQKEQEDIDTDDDDDEKVVDLIDNSSAKDELDDGISTTSTSDVKPRPRPDGRTEQKRKVKEAWKQHERMVAGEQLYIISTYWLRLWKNYVNYDDSPRSSTPTLNGNGNGNGNTTPPTPEKTTARPVNPLSLSSEFDIPRPETINNKELVERDDSEGQPIIAGQRTEGEDFDIIPESVWKLLFGYYGGGPEIKRTVIELGVRNEKIVEVRPIILMIRSSSTGPSPASSSSPPQGSTSSMYDYVIQRSRKSTLNDIREFICHKEGIDSQKLAVYRQKMGKQNKTQQKLLKKNSMTLDDLKFESENVIIFGQEEQKTFIGKLKGKFSSSKKDKPKDQMSPPHSQSSSTSSNSTQKGTSSSSSSSAQDSGPVNTPPVSRDALQGKGICGLTNLGNTCFMNTSVQCLAHTTAFTDYFLSNKYLADINKVNPLGAKGQIAEYYGKLIKEMWSGATVLIPKHLKWIIGKYAPQFSGISQQDTQELLSFLLDGLHEDLNKVVKKPYIEEKDDKEEREDSVVAAEQWERHLLRNQSIVVNLFQGQYKSTLVCSKCSKVSITFDPYMYVTLPIPVATERLFEVVLFRCTPVGTIGPDPNGVYSLNNALAPVRYCLKLPKRGFIQSLRVELSKLSGIDTPCLALSEIIRHRIYMFLSDQRGLEFIKDREVIIGYELPVAGEEVSRLHVMHRRKADLLLLPYVILCKFAEVTCKEVYRMVWERVGHRVKRGWKSAYLRQRSKENIPADTTGTGEATTSSTTTSPTTPSTTTTTNNETEKDSPAGSSDGSQPDTEDDTSSITDDETDEIIYPFILKSTNSYGTNCDRCQGIHCTGCVISCDGKVLKEIFKVPKFWSEGCSNIAIDWRPEMLRFLDDCEDIQNPQLIKQDKSVAIKSEMKNDINLNDCLTLFTKNEKLGPNDTWFCPQCKEHIQGNKKLELWSAPNILIIHLKRFQLLHRFEKIGSYVDFPLDNLDLSKWILNKNMANPPIYQLYAVAVSYHPTHPTYSITNTMIQNHMGGMGAGHYTASVRHKDKWYLISDSSYHSIEESSVKTSEAYVLFYELKKQSPTSNNNKTSTPPPSSHPTTTTTTTTTSVNPSNTSS
ncbi:hypothetical protein SAMD00019534_072730, partial [Acytostelium subglobosum LB1]|uniref:hypothetical protein n=1 Tax=Acytostelium subglobosum LB1 TaxID=1410327 RepID=UPI000644E200